jgi:hypothetical protein
MTQAGSLCYIAPLSVERRLEVMPEPSPRTRRDARRMCLGRLRILLVLVVVVDSSLCPFLPEAMLSTISAVLRFVYNDQGCNPGPNPGPACPFGFGTGPSGRMTGANQIQASRLTCEACQ